MIAADAVPAVVSWLTLTRLACKKLFVKVKTHGNVKHTDSAKLYSLLAAPVYQDIYYISVNPSCPEDSYGSRSPLGNSLHSVFHHAVYIFVCSQRYWQTSDDIDVEV